MLGIDQDSRKSHTHFLITSFWLQREQIHTIKDALQLISTPSSVSPRPYHTGIRIIQQIATMMGCAVLLHLQNPEAAASYGIKSSDEVLKVVNELKDEAEPYREMVMETSSCIYKESMTS